MNPIRRILAKLRRRKAKAVPLGRWFWLKWAMFNGIQIKSQN